MNEISIDFICFFQMLEGFSFHWMSVLLTYGRLQVTKLKYKQSNQAKKFEIMISDILLDPSNTYNVRGLFGNNALQCARFCTLEYF